MKSSSGKLLVMKRSFALPLVLSSILTLAQDEAQTKAMYPRWAKAQEYAAEGFNPVDCFAGQVRVRGKRLPRQSFAVFRANAQMKCCGEEIRNGRTDAHGHFVIEPLPEGEYFAQFTSKGDEYTVNFAVIQGYQRCETTHVELNFSALDQCSLQNYIDLDYSEKDCSEDAAACYRK